MDIVFLQELRIDTVIGVYDWERQIRQTVILDLEMGSDIQIGAFSDDIKDALDYKAVAKRLIQFVEGSHFNLVETLAEHCAKILMDEFHIPWLRLKINKLGAITRAVGVGVIIERGSRS